MKPFYLNLIFIFDLIVMFFMCLMTVNVNINPIILHNNAWMINGNYYL